MKSLIDIFNSSDKNGQIDTNRDNQTPISDNKITNTGKLEDARKGVIDDSKYSDKVSRG